MCTFLSSCNFFYICSNLNILHFENYDYIPKRNSSQRPKPLQLKHKTQISSLFFVYACYNQGRRNWEGGQESHLPLALVTRARGADPCDKGQQKCCLSIKRVGTKVSFEHEEYYVRH